MDLVLENVRVSYANGLYKADSIKGGEPKFGCDFLFTEGSKVF